MPSGSKGPTYSEKGRLSTHGVIGARALFSFSPLVDEYHQAPSMDTCPLLFDKGWLTKPDKGASSLWRVFERSVSGLVSFYLWQASMFEDRS